MLGPATSAAIPDAPSAARARSRAAATTRATWVASDGWGAPTHSAPPAEPIDSTDPADPIDSAEPAEPIDRTDPADPIERNDATDATEHAEATDSTDRWLSTLHTDSKERVFGSVAMSETVGVRFVPAPDARR